MGRSSAEAADVAGRIPGADLAATITRARRRACMDAPAPAQAERPGPRPRSKRSPAAAVCYKLGPAAAIGGLMFFGFYSICIRLALQQVIWEHSALPPCALALGARLTPSQR